MEIDLIEITKYIYLTFCLNSHTLRHSSLAFIQLSTGHLPDHTCFFVTMLALNCSRIHLSRSFFLLQYEISQTLRSHHTTLVLSLILPYKHHVFSFIYGNHYHRWYRTEVFVEEAKDIFAYIHEQIELQSVRVNLFIRWAICLISFQESRKR